MLSGLPRLPKNGSMTAHGMENVDFPLYNNNPTDFLPSHLRAVTVNEAKQHYRKFVVGWTEHQQQPVAILSDQLRHLTYPDQAKLMARFALTYSNHPSMPEILSSAVDKSLRRGDGENLEMSNRVMNLVGYLSHYADDRVQHTLKPPTTHSKNRVAES
jgi:hypothetical protein